MPIYEYFCNDCGHEFETLQKMSEAPLIDCPSCDQASLKKKLSAPGFRLSGSGWYETDFKSDKKRNLSQADSSEKPAKDNDAKAAKSETKNKGSGKEAAA